MSTDSNEYDVFVSYAHADNKTGQVEKFVEELRAEYARSFPETKLEVFIDKDAIRTGKDWENKLDNSIARSRVLMAFISPNYFKSDWCNKEWNAWSRAEIGKHVFGDGAFPLLLCEIPNLLGNQVNAREVATEISGDSLPPAPSVLEVSRMIEQLRRRQLRRDFIPFFSSETPLERTPDAPLKRLVNDLETQVTQVIEASRSASTIPPHNRNFSGRRSDLHTLRERLNRSATGVISGIHGLGGVGKTELAYAYAHAFAHAYPGGRFYVPCEKKATLQQAVLCLGDFREIRPQINDEERKNLDAHFSAILRCLEARLSEKGSILLVFDNVSDPALVNRTQTGELTSLGTNLHLLATTRLSPPANARDQWLSVAELPKEDALILLERFRPFESDTERTAAKEIVRRLGSFPLAVELVGAYLEAHPGATYAHIASKWDLQKLDEIADDKNIELCQHNHERRLGAVLGPILKELGAIERRTLEYASLLPPDFVALPWLRELVEVDFPNAFEPTSLLADPWREHCEKLERLALFNRVEDAGGELATGPVLVRVHRLVQELIRRDWESKHTALARILAFAWKLVRWNWKGKHGTRQAAVNALIERRDAELKNTTEWERARWELVPFAALGNLWDEWEHSGAAWLLNQAGQHWYKLAEYSEAEPLMKRALEIDEKSFGPSHPNVAIRLNDLAQLLQATNRLEEAEPLMKRALVIGEKSFGQKHPKVAIRLNNLASLLYETNRLEEAEPLMKRALVIDEKSFGPNHPNVAIHLNNLAQLLNATNRLEEAEPLMKRALEIDEKSFGPNHPTVARNLNNLAQLLQTTNRFEEAEPLMKRALEIDEKSFGPKHPTVARDLNNLAALLQATNRLPEAEPLMKRMLVILLNFTRRNGHEHPHLKVAFGNYIALLEKMGRSEEEIRATLHEIASERA